MLARVDFLEGRMQSKAFQGIALKLLIILAIILSGTTAFASCGWVLESQTCSPDTDPKGAYCDNAECHCGYDHGKTDDERIYRCTNPGWNCGQWWVPGGVSAWYCSCPGLLTDETYKWIPDPSNPCCGSPDPFCGAECIVEGMTQACTTSGGCEGSQTCSNKHWGECQQKSCCVSNTN